ncbi:MAG: TlpA family protein disulfide reductase [Rubripirellula sp.]
MTRLFEFPLLTSTLVILLVSQAGCGGSDSSSTSVVPPPAPVATAADEPADAEPPGGLELPSDAEIPASSGEIEKPSGGIELPSDLQVPPDNQGASVQPRVQYATWDEIQTVARSTGKITVVDLWSLACEPCLKEFPGLVKLQADYATVHCIAVDLDFDGRKSRPPQHYESQVTAFLKSVDAYGFPTYISQTPNEDVFAATKLPSIPAVLIYDLDGSIVKVFVDAGDTLGFTYEKDVFPLIAKLMDRA